MLQELVIKVPAPFVGRADVGFSARYPAQPAQAPLKDVPFFIEGPSGPMRRLQSRLELFRQKRSLIPDAPGEAYSWTDLIPLNDELFILAFRHARPRGAHRARHAPARKPARRRGRTRNSQSRVPRWYSRSPASRL